MAEIIYKIEAQGDAVYIQAATEPEAIDKLHEYMGAIPGDLLTITIVTADQMPEGEELLT